MKSNKCTIELFEEPLYLTLDDIDDSYLQVYFAFGIVNPYGPTLTFVATAGDAIVGHSLPLLKVMLNPFKQSVEQIGKFWVGETWEPLADLAPLLTLSYGDAPTLLFLSNIFTEQGRSDFATKIFNSFENVPRLFRSLEKFPCDPWSRVAAAIRGENDNFEYIKPYIAATLLSKIIFTPEHIKVEIAALLYAWNGSLEETGISEDLKRTAMTQDQFRKFLFKRVIPVVWLPEIESEEAAEPEVKHFQKLKIESIGDLKELMSHEAWRDFDEDRLISLLRITLYLYGRTYEEAYVHYITQIYKQVKTNKIPVETLTLLEEDMVGYVESEKIWSGVFSPFIVHEIDRSLVAKAAIDLVSTSGIVDGENQGIKSIKNLFNLKAMENPGAVFGGLLSMGDKQNMPFLQEIFPSLNIEQINIAAQTHSPFPQHHAIQFWITTAKNLAISEDVTDQKIFGACASALILVLKYDQVNAVSEGRRHYPSFQSEMPIELINKWTLSEYADKIAFDLYQLEDIEDKPKLFSDVLRQWGLHPRAPIDDQFIPDTDYAFGTNQKLRDPLTKRKTFTLSNISKYLGLSK